MKTEITGKQLLDFLNIKIAEHNINNTTQIETKWTNIIKTIDNVVVNENLYSVNDKNVGVIFNTETNIVDIVNGKQSCSYETFEIDKVIYTILDFTLDK